MARIAPLMAIATCSRVVGQVEEDMELIRVLSRKGIQAVHAVWDDRDVHWSSFAMIVIRSTWDYPDCHDEFLRWANQLSRVLNPAPILTWNTDKRYLQELANVGLPVIPTTFLEPGQAFEVPGSSFVIKPAVSCGAKDTARFFPNDGDEAHAHVRRLHHRGRTVMVQPYLPRIEESGETAIMFTGGRYSHAIRRDAVLRHVGVRDQGAVPVANVRSHDPTPAERRLADDVMAHVPGGTSQLLYGRVDIIPGPDGNPLLMELELTEPSLFLEFQEGAVDRLADGVVAALHGS